MSETKPILIENVLIWFQKMGFWQPGSNRTIIFKWRKFLTKPRKSNACPIKGSWWSYCGIQTCGSCSCCSRRTCFSSSNGFAREKQSSYYKGASENCKSAIVYMLPKMVLCSFVFSVVWWFCAIFTLFHLELGFENACTYFFFLCICAFVSIIFMQGCTKLWNTFSTQTSPPNAVM